MIDALREEASVQGVPTARLVGMDRGAERDAASHDRGFLGLGDEGQGTAAALASDHDDAALTALILGLAAVDPIGLAVLRANVAAEIRAVDFDRTGRRVVLGLGRHGFTQLVREHERRLVLHVEVAGELQGRVTLGAVHEDRDGQEVRADRQLAAGEDRARRDRELMLAGLALPELAGGDEAMGESAAARADRIAARVAPTDHAEGIVGFLAAHARDFAQTERPCRAREEKMLGHVASAFRCWQR